MKTRLTLIGKKTYFTDFKTYTTCDASYELALDKLPGVNTLLERYPEIRKAFAKRLRRINGNACLMNENCVLFLAHGRAVCIPPDVFDEETGRDIAALRMDAKAHETAAKIVDALIKVTADAFFTSMEKCADDNWIRWWDITEMINKVGE